MKIKTYKTPARPVLEYGSKDQTICKCDEHHFVANRMKFLGRITRYTKLNKMRNTYWYI